MFVAAARILGLIGLLFAVSVGTAAAEIVRQEFKSDSTREVKGEQAPPFHIQVEGRPIKGYIVYTITNLGEDWPTHAFAGLFASRSGNKLDNARIRLKSGEKFQLVVDFKGNPVVSMDFIMRPRWVPQQILMRVYHQTPEGWREAGAARHGRVLNNESAAVTQ